MDEFQKGKLYLCATPIGNLEDMPVRAIRLMKEADVIAAEDTRNSIKLINHFQIDTPLSFATIFIASLLSIPCFL